MKKTISVALAAVALVAALPASAQFAKPEDAIKYRKSALTVLAQHFGHVAGMASGKVAFDAKAAAEDAAIAEFVGKLPWAGFVAGSDKGDTRAKPEIWSDKAKFDEAAAKLQRELAKLTVAAKAGNPDGIKSAVNGVGGACKACHDDFRAK